jgi:hypothetical protein
MRPLIYKHIELNKVGEKFMNDRQIQQYLERQIEELLNKVAVDFAGNPKTPQIRLKIDYTGYNVVSSH